MDKQLEKQLMACLLDSYKDFDNPDFAFVGQKLYSDERCRLRGLLSKYDIIDDTDLNYEVCQTFVARGKKASNYLYISLVGSFYFIMNEVHVITKSNAERDIEISWIDKMDRAGMIMMDKNQLLHCLPVAMEMFDISEGGNNEKYSSVLHLFFCTRTLYS